jgi:hypothetical protein
VRNLSPSNTSQIPSLGRRVQPGHLPKLQAPTYGSWPPTRRHNRSDGPQGVAGVLTSKVTIHGIV